MWMHEDLKDKRKKSHYHQEESWYVGANLGTPLTLSLLTLRGVTGGAS